MKVPKLLFVVIAVFLMIPMVGCNLIGQNPIAAIGSLVPQVTPEDTVEATVDSGEATAESTPLIRPKTVAATVRPKTAVATAKPKATAAKTAAATAKPKATVKPTVTKAPTNGVDSNLPIGANLLSDDFSDPSSGWAEYSSDLTEMGYQDNKYVITVHDANWLSWSSTNQTYSDFVVEVAAAKASGPSDGEYGIIFRYQNDTNYYIFKVNATGSSIVSVLVDGTWGSLSNWAKNSAIKTGSAVNKLAIVAQGEKLTFYVNDIMVDELTDSTFAEGDIAIVAGTQDVGELVAEFSSVNIWEVGEGTSPTSEANGSISKGTKLYSETFADPSTGWDEWDSAGKSRAGYENGKYFIEILAVNRMTWGNGYQDFDDFIMEVETTKVAGPDDNAFGIVLRYVDSDNFYVFKASSDGQYAFGYYLDNVWTEVVPWSLTDTVNQGDSTNKLSVACKGNRFILSINGTVVEDLTDDTFSAGDIGLMAASRSEAGVNITFDNVNVWAIK